MGRTDLAVGVAWACCDVGERWGIVGKHNMMHARLGLRAIGGLKKSGRGKAAAGQIFGVKSFAIFSRKHRKESEQQCHMFLTRQGGPLPKVQDDPGVRGVLRLEAPRGVCLRVENLLQPAGHRLVHRRRCWRGWGVAGILGRGGRHQAQTLSQELNNNSGLAFRSRSRQF